MAGIYIHIPFCRKACHYCNFHFSTQTDAIAPFVNALLKEIKLQSGYLTEPVETIYFGGGTPSLLPISLLENIMGALHSNYAIAENIELTLEANPDDIDGAKLNQWKSIGINRLSIGIQSFQANSLAWMNRAHTVSQSHQAIELAQKAGIHNLSVDLIYGTPNLTDQALKADLQIIEQFQIPHVSCYALTVEEKTALAKMIEQQKIAAVDPDHQAKHFEIVQQALSNQGMEHYEISNFAKPGYRSKHNSSYWKGIPYLGLGPSAHSYNGASRQWNIANNQLYIKSIEEGTVPFEIELLSIASKYNEYMMISLRCMEGFDFAIIEEKFGPELVSHTKQIAAELADSNKIEKTKEGYKITDQAKFFADGIASDFFYISNT